MTSDLHAPAGSLSTVLCVDDEPNVLAALNRVLRGAGFCVMSAQSGAQAIAMLEQIPVDLVISDMRMPNMDGAALLEQVRLRWPQIVRLLLTGHANTESTIAAINRGQVFRYLRKPWEEHELLSAVQQGLQMCRIDRERLRLQALATSQNEALLALNADLERRGALVCTHERTRRCAGQATTPPCSVRQGVCGSHRDAQRWHVRPRTSRRPASTRSGPWSRPRGDRGVRGVRGRPVARHRADRHR